jgi:hypothetical protein
MNTYTALVAAQVGNTRKLVKTEVKAASTAEAKWLLQAIYGFHAVSSMPSEKREVLTSEDLSQPKTPDQQRINSLKAAKDRASDALTAERDRQKKQSAMKTLSSLSNPSSKSLHV